MGPTQAPHVSVIHVIPSLFLLFYLSHTHFLLSRQPAGEWGRRLPGRGGRRSPAMRQRRRRWGQERRRRGGHHRRHPWGAREASGEHRLLVNGPEHIERLARQFVASGAHYLSRAGNVKPPELTTRRPTMSSVGKAANSVAPLPPPLFGAAAKVLFARGGGRNMLLPGDIFILMGCVSLTAPPPPSPRRRRRLGGGGEAGGPCRRQRWEPERQEAGTGATAAVRQDQAPLLLPCSPRPPRAPPWLPPQPPSPSSPGRRPPSRRSRPPLLPPGAGRRRAAAALPFSLWRTWITPVEEKVCVRERRGERGRGWRGLR